MASAGCGLKLTAAVIAAYSSVVGRRSTMCGDLETEGMGKL
jgi:hypothetical protein